MNLKILGSSSRGNCYLLIDESGETLAVEAGVRFCEVQKAMNFKTSNLVGCLVSHEHGDHAKYINAFTLAAIDVYCSTGTKQGYSTAVKIAPHRIHEIESGVIFNVGDFRIYPFDVVHDAAQPMGFLINHPESGNILFLTDSFYSEFTFKNLNNIILEVNYDEEILEGNITAGRIPASLRQRIVTSHMSLTTAKELLSANDLSNVNNIVLIHLSDGNSHSERFQKEIQAHTGKSVTVADSGMQINLDKIPF